MNKVNSSKRFLVIFITSLICFILVYPLTYNALVTQDSLINHSYKDFLLRYTKSPRLIIDSGSNSTYGINSGILEKKLGVLTINLSDNAGYPLREKLYRIEKFAHKGDVILLPLEWPHYFYKETPWFFLESLFFELNFYYHEMPIFIKLNLIAKLPFASAMRILFKKTTQTTPIEKHIQTEYMRFLDYKLKFHRHERGDSKEAIVAGNNKDKDMSCNEYIFGKGLGYDVIKNGFVISEKFKQNIALIKKLQNKGIQVLFTWPTVVGDDCYKGAYADMFQTFITNLKYYLNENNILFIGTPEDSRFEQNYLFNSYYHVIANARDNRTQTLIAAIEKSPAINWFKKEKNIQYSLSINEAILKKKIILSLPIKQENNIINATQDDIFLASGWYPIELWGVWSKEDESVIYVKLERNLLQQDLQLTIENDLYKTHDSTMVSINDKRLGSYLLKGRKSIIIPQHYLTDKTGLVKIQFNHSHVKSPLEYGDNQDDRKIKFGLKSLQFTRLHN